MRSSADPRLRIVLIIAIASWAGFTLIRATGPDDLLSRDQVKMGGYVLDIVENDAWLWQQDHAANFASKPPLSQWLAAAATHAIGSFHRLTLTFPSWCSTLFTILILVGWVGREFGSAAALWVPLLLLVNQMGLRETLLARSDPLFQCTVVLLALAIWRCWVDGARAWPMALWGTAAVMTKGPLGWLMALAGLLAARWQPASNRRPVPWKSIAVALLASLVLPAIWLWSAQQSSGGLAVDKLIGNELIGHLFGAREEANQQSWSHHLLPIPWFLMRLAPAGLIAAFAAIRIIRNPASDEREQRAERFLLCWLLGGLVLLCIGTHHRFVHLLVVLPPAAMLASREVSRWCHPRRAPVYAIVALSSLLPLAAVYIDVIDIQQPRIMQTAELNDFCREVKKELAPGDALEFFAVDPATQVQLARHQPPLDERRIAEVLSREQQTFVIVGVETRFRSLASEQGIDLFEVRIRKPFGTDQLTLYSGQGRQPGAAATTDLTRNYSILTILTILTAACLFSALRFAASSLAASRSAPADL